MSDLKMLFRKSGMTHADIATAVGRTPGAISQWATGRVQIPAEMAIPLSDVTGIPLHELRPDLWKPPAGDGE